jgi:PKHD-type hydroxylase
VLSKAQIREARAIMERAQWIDGNATAGFQSALAKNNLQLPEVSAQSRQLGDMVLDGLARSPLFISAALPLKIFPPLFNCYRGGQEFGTHIDNAIRPIKGTPHRIRTDLSATLFLCEPDEYDGGELAVEDTYGVHRAKLPAGDLILYPASSLHHVAPVTRGSRLASFFWIESMVRDDGERTLLFDLDNTIQRLAGEKSHKDPNVVQLTGVYHNLLRRWADT